jgi:hypothetical protein
MSVGAQKPNVVTSIAHDFKKEWQTKLDEFTALKQSYSGMKTHELTNSPDRRAEDLPIGKNNRTTFQVNVK